MTDALTKKRRELVALRRHYKGNDPVTFRITLMLGQLTELTKAKTSARRTQVERLILRTARELDELTARQS